MKKLELIYLYFYLFTSYTIVIGRSQFATNHNRDSENYINNNVEFVSTTAPHTNEQSLKIITDSNKKPRFTDCDSYNRAQVKEEQTEKTFVIKVHAEDDDPPDAGGTVSYKFVQRDGGRAYFVIDNTTGEVRSNYPFDRDEPMRQKEMYVTVEATDNGRPPLSDICTFKVTITDINDNEPSLEQQVYKAQVAEDLKVNSEILRMYAYDFDDGENSRVTYSIRDGDAQFSRLFKIDENTGVMYLQESLQGRVGAKFTSRVVVHDNGVNSKSSDAGLNIEVVDSDKKTPSIIEINPPDPLHLNESFRNFTKHLVTIVAESNIADKDIVFELIKGKTLQTNKDQTFVLIPSPQNSYTAYIMLARPLDYETVTDYTLSVRIKNKDLMDTFKDIPIRILDVNDELPNFIELIKGSVVENDDPGAPAMVVRAIDKDGTSANNIVNYELLSYSDVFSIDKQSGVIKSLQRFDREMVSVFHVKVRAYDNSPSALIIYDGEQTGEPNEAVQTFQISIEDRNDNAPKFTKSVYNYSGISEITDKDKTVGGVKAEDKDSAALITYSIVDGNIGDAFYIENTTGRVKVKNQLDFEKIEHYRLRVRAFDGIFEDFAILQIFISNVNDEVPTFETALKKITIQEEDIPEGCIINVKAFDPDIKDRTADQHILYTVSADFLNVTQDGCVKLQKKLDRDRPFGVPFRQAFIYAYDNDGGPNSLNGHSEIVIELEDINDNAPFLNITEVVWYENQDPDGSNEITQLTADDYDGPDNGPPFKYELFIEASEDIKSKFSIIGDRFYADVTFDREEKKYYDVPILITDSGKPVLSDVSILRVIIGDRNDNEAKDGSSEIFVYKYENWKSDIVIGRVFVDDLDDWDLPDKVFVQLDNFDKFVLSTEDKGMIIMYSTTEEGKYDLRFNVSEENTQIPLHTVSGNVVVTVKNIPEEAVLKSGSIRIKGSSIEQFIEIPSNGPSKKDHLQQRISEIMNTSRTNVDVFTVLKTPSNDSLIDIRFSAHGSPYYVPEKLNNKVTLNQDKLEQELGVEFVMVSINECLNENACGIGNSCSNQLQIKNDEAAVVYTNRTSFVGVKSFVEAKCYCARKNPVCINGGKINLNGTCSCPGGYEGPYCELISVAFKKTGWAIYPGFETCNATEIILQVAPQDENGLIFYAGPLTAKHALLSKDFVALELRDGIPVLKIDNGNGPIEVSPRDSFVRSLKDDSTHKIRISIVYTTTDTNIELEIDDCKSNCIQVKTLPPGLLHINGPLQIGGLSSIFAPEDSKKLWAGKGPTQERFMGCVKNYTFNGDVINVGQPSDFSEAFPDCNYGMQQAVTFGIDPNFLVAILVCFGVLCLLLLAVVVHKRRHDNINEKDIDDTTENIINYEDEGGGECDAHFNLSVFPLTPTKDAIQRKDNPDIGPVEPDISDFLDTKKDNCDKDPDSLPYDDVRHYAYEGDGNSTGSLSSLGSCTDDGDLDFNYLSSFGKRFSKLADLYDCDGSDDDTQNAADDDWC